MIPKVIHYCWFGNGEKPKSVIKCMESWKAHCPDYKIVEWNESNFDVNMCEFTQKAYSQRKFAFVSDVARLVAIQKQGGIYVDTDVEIIKNMDCLLDNKGFIGFENNNYVNSGQIIAGEENNQMIAQMIEHYKNIKLKENEPPYSFISCPIINTQILLDNGLQKTGKKQVIEDMTVYPVDYFNPLNSATNKLSKTDNTYSIHWYSQSWMPASLRLKSKLTKIAHRILGEDCFKKLKH